MADSKEAGIFVELQKNPVLKNAMLKLIQIHPQIQEIEEKYKHSADKAPHIKALVKSLENNFEGRVAAAVEHLLVTASSAQVDALFNIYYDPGPLAFSRVDEAKAPSEKEAEIKNPPAAAREQILISYFSLLLAKLFLDTGKNIDRLRRMFISDPQRNIEQQGVMPPLPPRLRLMMTDPTQLTAEERKVQDSLLKQAIEEEEIVREGRSAFRGLLTLPRRPLEKSDVSAEKKSSSAMPSRPPSSVEPDQRVAVDAARKKLDAEARKKQKEQEKLDLELAEKLQKEEYAHESGSTEPGTSSSMRSDSDDDNSSEEAARSDFDNDHVVWVAPPKREVLPRPVSLSHTSIGGAGAWKPLEAKISFNADGEPIEPETDYDNNKVDYVVSSLPIPESKDSGELRLEAGETEAIIAGMKRLRASKNKPFTESQFKLTKETLKEVATEYLFAASSLVMQAAKTPSELPGFMLDDKKYGGFEFSSSKNMLAAIEQFAKKRVEIFEREIKNKMAAKEVKAPRPAAHSATPPPKKTDAEIAKELQAKFDAEAKAKEKAEAEAPPRPEALPPTSPPEEPDEEETQLDAKAKAARPAVSLSAQQLSEIFKSEATAQCTAKFLKLMEEKETLKQDLVAYIGYYANEISPPFTPEKIFLSLFKHAADDDNPFCDLLTNLRKFHDLMPSNKEELTQEGKKFFQEAIDEANVNAPRPGASIPGR